MKEDIQKLIKDINVRIEIIQEDESLSKAVKSYLVHECNKFVVSLQQILLK